ncbi:MAG: hypothetical protein M3O41_16345 [Pseudomonadota bacterium]|nr:hypothetical protein [Pseudomonadota bacterium]
MDPARRVWSFEDAVERGWVTVVPRAVALSMMPTSRFFTLYRKVPQCLEMATVVENPHRGRALRRSPTADF